MAEKPLDPALYGNALASELRKQNEQMGDIEFEMAMAPYNNYTGGTPADKAKYEGLFPGAGTYTKRGQFAPPDMTEEQIKREGTRYYNEQTDRKETLYGIPDTVQALAGGAVPKVWQHEFNHRNNPDWSENRTRTADGVIAPNKRAWNDAVRMEQDRVNRRRRSGNEISLEDAEKGLLYRLRDMHHPWSGPLHTAKDVYEGEMERGGSVPKAMRTKQWFTDYSEQDHLDDYAKMRKEQAYWPKALRAMQEE